MAIPKKRPDSPILPSVEDMVRELVAAPEKWLDTENDQLGGEKPRDLIGTPREAVLRNMVVDLTRLTSRDRIETSAQELTGDWLAYLLRNPNRPRGGMNGTDVRTQLLGRRLERIRGIEGFQSYSARIATRKTLMVFPHKRLQGSQFRYRDPTTGNWKILP